MSVIRNWDAKLQSFTYEVQTKEDWKAEGEAAFQDLEPSYGNGCELNYTTKLPET